MINSELSCHGLHCCANTVLRCNVQGILGSLYAVIPFPRQFLRSNLWVMVTWVNATYPSVFSPAINVFAIGRCDVNLTNQPFAESSFVECRWYIYQLLLDLSESSLSRDTLFLSDRTNSAPVHSRGERANNSHFNLFVTWATWAEIDRNWIPCVRGDKNDRQVCRFPVCWDAGVELYYCPLCIELDEVLIRVNAKLICIERVVFYMLRRSSDLVSVFDFYNWNPMLYTGEHCEVSPFLSTYDPVQEVPIARCCTVWTLD